MGTKIIIVFTAAKLIISVFQICFALSKSDTYTGYKLNRLPTQGNLLRNLES